jgi:hypothetical protein
MMGHKMISLIAFIMLAILAATAFIVSLIKTDLVDKETTTSYTTETTATFDATGAEATNSTVLYEKESEDWGAIPGDYDASQLDYINIVAYPNAVAADDN